MSYLGGMLRAGFLSVIILSASAWAQEDSPPASPRPAETNSLSAPPVFLPSEVDYDRIRAWAGLAHVTGPGIGYGESYTTFEGFIPLYQGNVGILFSELRGVLTNSAFVDANLGAGYRYYSSEGDRIWGSNVFWDLRDTGQHTFNQIGFGFESLGRYWDARANVYLVTGPEQKETFAVFAHPTFVQHFIQLDRIGIGQAAMSGFDAEVGMPLSCRWGLKAYLGTYDFQAPDSPQAWGFKARLEERLTDNLDLNLTYANDHVFGNSIVFSAGFRFGGRASRAGAARCDTYARRADRVERNAQIVVTDQTLIRRHVLATNPATGQPIIVQHADSNAAPGGDGTVEHPFQSLTLLQAGSGPGQILFVHANSVFDGQLITLQNGQRFLGEGGQYLFTSSQGTFLLPRATMGTSAPVIQNIPGFGAITLASDSEVAGFQILEGGILGRNIAGVNVHNNTIVLGGGGSGGSFGGGIVLDNVVGQSFIVNNSLFNIVAGDGITATFFGAGPARLTIAGNRLERVNGYGIRLLTGGTGYFFQIANNVVLEPIAQQGIDVEAGGASSICLQLLNNFSQRAIFLTKNSLSTFQVENTLGSNTPFPSLSTTGGTITIVPVGTCGFPSP